MAASGGDGGLGRSSGSAHEAATFCCASDEEGWSPHPARAPHQVLLNAALFLHLCGVASPPGTLRTSVRIWHRHVGEPFSERDLQILGQPGKKGLLLSKISF